MKPKEYFITVARLLDGVRTPKDLRPDEAVNYLIDLYERNIAPEIAAEFIIQKFGYTKVNSELN